MTDSQSPNRSARRRHLLQVARTLMERDGYAKTSVSAIVREAGVAQGTFYLYFRSKAHLLAHLRAQALGVYLTGFTDALGEGPQDAQLVRGLAALATAVRAQQDLLRVLNQAESGEDTLAIMRQGRDRFADLLAPLLAAGAAAGVFVLEDAHMASHLLLALFDDLVYDAVAYAHPASIDAVLPAGTRFALRALGVAEARIDQLLPFTLENA